jgi:hypothetical protein
LPPSFPEDRVGAFLFRFIATPNFETIRFLKLAREHGLLPVVGEYHSDKYAPCNPNKRALGLPGFLSEDKSVVHIKVVGRHPNSQPLCDMHTRWGQSLVEFHHGLYAHELNGLGNAFFVDYSRQYAIAGANPQEQYPEVFRAAVADGIIFEDFLVDETECQFTREVVLPAFDEVTERFGLRPLIVRIASVGQEESPDWLWYPGRLQAFVQDCRRNCVDGRRISRDRAKEGLVPLEQEL